MVSTAINTGLDVDFSSLVSEEIEYVTAETMVNEFHFLVPSLYTRDKVSQDPDVVAKYKKELIFRTGKKETVWIKDPLDYIQYTEEELLKFGLTELTPDVKYLVNGNNRKNAVETMITEKVANRSFLEIPTRKVNATTRETLIALQHLSNNTTVPQSEGDRLRMIAKYIEQQTALGNNTEKQIFKVAQELFDVSAQTISNAKKFSDPRFAPIFEMVDQGICAEYTAITIVQACEALNISGETVCALLRTAYALDLSRAGAKFPINEPKVKAWRKAYEAAQAQTEDENDGFSDSENTEKEVDSEDELTDVDVSNLEEESIAALKLLDQIASYEPISDHEDLYRIGIKSLVAVLKVIQPLSGSKLFIALAKAVLKEFQGEILYDLDDADLSTVATNLKILTTKKMLHVILANEDEKEEEVVEEDLPIIEAIDEDDDEDDEDDEDDDEEEDFME